MGWIKDQLSQHKERKQAKQAAKDRETSDYVSNLIKRAKRIEADGKRANVLSKIYQEVPDVMDGDPLTEMDKFADVLINTNPKGVNQGGIFGDLLRVFKSQDIPSDDDPGVVAANKLELS